MAGLLKAKMPQEAQSAQAEDPALERAIEFMGTRLYDSDEELAIDIANQVGSSQVSMPLIMAKVAYALAQSADAETDGQILEENLSVLGMIALNEVFEIADRTGVPIKDGDVSSAFKHMVVLFSQDQGLTPEQIEMLTSAMSQVNDDELAAAAQEVPDEAFEALPDDDNPGGADLERAADAAEVEGVT